MKFPTWGQLVKSHCSVKLDNPYYEEFANRRYNFGASIDKYSCRLIFLKDVLKKKGNKTLRRKGRFLWCRNLQYEGVNEDGVRGVSFTIDRGQKRFYVGENNLLCLPSRVCVSNNRFFKSRHKTFLPFSTVFSYANSFNMMLKNSGHHQDEFCKILNSDSPYQPGTLVTPRVGYFFPDIQPQEINKTIADEREHPCGIILGPSLLENDYVRKEFYRVRFGKTTYERVHPVQMEIVNEV